MLDIGGWEFLVVAFILVMVVGPKELPGMLKSFSRFMRQTRKVSREFTDSLHQIADEAEISELRGVVNQAKSGNLDHVANVIDPDGDAARSMREIRDGVDNEIGDDIGDEIRRINSVTDENGVGIAGAPRPPATRAPQKPGTNRTTRTKRNSAARGPAKARGAGGTGVAARRAKGAKPATSTKPARKQASKQAAKAKTGARAGG